MTFLLNATGDFLVQVTVILFSAELLLERNINYQVLFLLLLIHTLIELEQFDFARS